MCCPTIQSGWTSGDLIIAYSKTTVLRESSLQGHFTCINLGKPIEPKTNQIGPNWIILLNCTCFVLGSCCCFRGFLPAVKKLHFLVHNHKQLPWEASRLDKHGNPRHLTTNLCVTDDGRVLARTLQAWFMLIHQHNFDPFWSALHRSWEISAAKKRINDEDKKNTSCNVWLDRYCL